MGRPFKAVKDAAQAHTACMYNIIWLYVCMYIQYVRGYLHSTLLDLQTSVRWSWAELGGGRRLATDWDH
jgi:hypothetical protein